ncbi:MAG TPA: hypothetical protein VMP67_09350 [Candidatus Limnocylindria bacterium]|nr:hypothetical protein [Candidatus Limnocylindria bacterium]
MVICRNCGFQNAPGDAFCGSCGQFMEWAADEPGAADEAGQARAGGQEETVVQPPLDAEGGPALPPPPPPRHQARPTRPEAPPRMARPVQSGVTYGAINCWNCGRRNATSRAFCQQCGERLSVGSLPGAGAGRSGDPAGGGGTARLLAIGLGVVALLLLAGGAAAILLSNPGPSASPTPTPIAAVTGSPPPPSLPASAAPTELPTLPPTEAPSEPPTLAPTPSPEPSPTEPPVAPFSCANSTVPTNWANLSGANPTARVRVNQAWCIHRVIVVPDPNFGVGSIRFRVNDELFVRVDHEASSTETEYPFNFTPAELALGRQDVEYRMLCGGGLCNAVIQVGYEVLTRP